MENKALIILSGGQDSTTCLFHAINEVGRENVSSISFDYGQRHKAELMAAAKIADLAGITYHEVIDIRGIMVSTSPLMPDNELNALEQYSNYAEMVEQVGKRTEATFVPMRNALFLNIAANRAYALSCGTILIGVSQEDTANYPDTTSDFIMSTQYMINRALGKADLIKIETPLMYMTKAQSIRYARTLPGCWEALAYSHTSYAGEYPPVDNNHANILRAKGFEESGFPDPLVIRAYEDGLMPLPMTSNYDSIRNYSCIRKYYVERSAN